MTAIMTALSLSSPPTTNRSSDNLSNMRHHLNAKINRTRLLRIRPLLRRFNRQHNTQKQHSRRNPTFRNLNRMLSSRQVRVTGRRNTRTRQRIRRLTTISVNRPNTLNQLSNSKIQFPMLRQKDSAGQRHTGHTHIVDQQPDHTKKRPLPLLNRRFLSPILISQGK